MCLSSDPFISLCASYFIDIFASSNYKNKLAGGERQPHRIALRKTLSQTEGEKAPHWLPVTGCCASLFPGTSNGAARPYRLTTGFHKSLVPIGFEPWPAVPSPGEPTVTLYKSWASTNYNCSNKPTNLAGSFTKFHVILMKSNVFIYRWKKKHKLTTAIILTPCLFNKRKKGGMQLHTTHQLYKIVLKLIVYHVNTTHLY